MFKIVPNPDKIMFNNMSKAVKANEGYCPCMLEKNDDTKCICKEFQEQIGEDECHCGRYMKVLI